MIEQLPEASITHEQFGNASDHAQLGACRATRAHSPQPTIALLMRGERAAKFRQHRDGNSNKREHPCPGFEATNTCLGKTEQSFCITKAFFTGEAPRVLSRHSMSRQVAVRHQVPDAPATVLVTRTGLHQKHLSRVAYGVP